MKGNKPILLVEDDDVDAMTLERAMKDLGLTNPLHRAVNGEEALAYLKDLKGEAPGIILLDLNMPRMNGIEFLKELKGDERLRTIPAVVLTTSKEERDKTESFRLGAAGYMVKPVEYDQFVAMMRTIRAYWSASELAE